MERVDLAFRLFLPLYFLAFILVGGPVGVALFKRRYGFDPHALEDPHPLMKLGERYRDVILGIVLLVTLLHAVWPEIHYHLGPVSLLETPFLRWTGVVILILSLVFMRVSQLQMKSEWRHGLDRAHPPGKLITSGLYSISRNPIYLGMTGAAVGLLLALPNAVTVTVVCMTPLLLDVRIRIEEEFLLEHHGEAYRAYCSRTPRWLFSFGPKSRPGAKREP